MMTCMCRRLDRLMGAVLLTSTRNIQHCKVRVCQKPVSGDKLYMMACMRRRRAHQLMGAVLPTSTRKIQHCKVRPCRQPVGWQGCI
jgi:hypothetical protein